MLGRYKGHAVGRLSVRAREPGGGAWSEAVAGRPRENPAIASAWARGQVRKLEDRYVAGTRHDLDELERQIVSVSLRFGVLSRFTAYVAIDRSAMTNTTGKLHRITQPVESPEGWACATPPRRPCSSATHRAALIEAACLSDSLACSSPAAPHRLTSAPEPEATRRLGRRLAPPEKCRARRHPRRVTPLPTTPKSCCDLLESIEAGLPDRFIDPDAHRAGGHRTASSRPSIATGDESVRVESLRLSPDQAAKLPVAAQLLPGLSHPAIQPILEVVPDGERVFLVTEDTGRASGWTRSLRHRSPTFEETARWIAEIAEGIQHGHEQGIELLDLIWCDISIRDDGHAIMTEPARWLFAIVGFPEIYGNVSPLAPELFTGAIDGGSPERRLQPRRHLLPAPDRRHAVQGGGLELIRKILHDVPPPPRTIRRSVPKELESICLKAMARKPEDRYATPGELAAGASQITWKPSRGRRRSFWKRS